MDTGGISWSMLTIIGVVVLGAVIAWAALRNRAERRDGADSEAATRQLYEEEDREHRGESDAVP